MHAFVCLLLAASVLAEISISEAADPRAIQQKLDAIAEQYSRLESRLALTEAHLVKLDNDLGTADQILKSKADAMAERAGYVYKKGSFGTHLEGLFLTGDAQEFVERLKLLKVMGSKDAQLVDEVRLTKSRGAELRGKLNATRRRQKALLDRLRAKQRELKAELEQARSGIPVTSVRPVNGFVLPVLGPVGFTNSWGAPRPGGRLHRGTDLMAPCGARVVSVTDGVISDWSRGGNGGTMLWIRATNGDIFFYAHLRGYSDGTRVGKGVRAGELIAYNGNSGNARGGPCHVHFEWHPKGGRPANPYGLLRAAGRA